jgi:hypothetical protein
MTERDNTDVWTALAIGAVVGIGATLLLRAQQDDTSDIVKKLRPMRRGAQKVVKAAGKRVVRGMRSARGSGEEWVSAGRDVLDELQEGARDIVHETRSELRKVAREAIREAQRAARHARR